MHWLRYRLRARGGTLTGLGLPSADERVERERAWSYQHQGDSRGQQHQVDAHAVPPAEWRRPWNLEQDASDEVLDHEQDRHPASSQAGDDERTADQLEQRNEDSPELRHRDAEASRN